MPSASVFMDRAAHQASQPLDAESPIDEPGLQKHARLAGDAEHRSNSRAAQILHQSTEPHRVRIGSGLEYDAAGQPDRDRRSPADSVHESGGGKLPALASAPPPAPPPVSASTH